MQGLPKKCPAWCRETNSTKRTLMRNQSP